MAVAILLMPALARCSDTLISAQFESSDYGATAVNYSGVEPDAATANPAFSQANVWNDLAFGGLYGGAVAFSNLVNSSGTSTAASLSISHIDGAYNNGTGTLPDTYFYSGITGITSQFTFSGLPPNQSFILFLYASQTTMQEVVFREAVFTVGSSTFDTASGNTSSEHSTAATGIITGTTSATGTISGTWAAGPQNRYGEIDWSGFQLYVGSPGNLGKANVCPSGQTTPAPCSQTLTLTFGIGAATTLGTPKVVTQGAPNLDFTLASGSTCTGAVTAGSSCVVNVTFTPRFAGERLGAVQLTDSTGNVVATTLLQGTGVGPQIAFGSAPQNTVGSGLSEPYGVAVDAAGDVFVVDVSTSSVLKVAPGGAQTTVFSSLSLPSAVAVDGAGDVFITVLEQNSIVKLTPGGVQTAVGSGLQSPRGVAVDAAGDVFVADEFNNRVVKVAPDGSQTTLASALTDPVGVAVDAAGDVFIADAGKDGVLKLTPGGSQTTVGSGLSNPTAVAVDAAGDVFIADKNNSRVVEVTPGGAQTTVASGLASPDGVAVDGAGDVFIADISGARVLEVQRSQPPSLSFTATVGSSDSSQSLTVENIGNAALTAITPGLTISANFAQIPGSGTPADCTSGFALAPGESCNIGLSFTPQSAGSLQGTAVLTDNALNGNPATQSIPLSGTGTQLNQTIAFNPIPNQVLGTTVTLSASASSGLQVSFQSLTPAICTVSGTTATLVSVGTCTIQAMQAGNSLYQAAAPVSQSFSVMFAFTGFFQPVNNPPTVNLVRAGSAIPVTFSLGGNQGSNILAAGYPISNPVSCTSGAPTSDIGQTVTAGSSSLGYNATTNQYTYVWKTNKSWSGTCQQFILTLTDGTTHTATFQFN